MMRKEGGMMLHFASDYMEGAHPSIIGRLAATNMEQTPGYCTDDYCESARKKIRSACNAPQAQVHFLIGGTQTNAVAISSVLKPHQGVIAAMSGHINQHESGAIEAGGHKVLALPHKNGKLAADDVRKYILDYYDDESYEHIVAPGMVYISHPTEYGTLYTVRELEALSSVCREFSIPLYMDGARLGYALAAPENELTIEKTAALCDMFYIGGTKVGALFGEALVITRSNLVSNMFSIIKQKGAMLAKGRLLGIQFDTLFTDGLYVKIARNAIDTASVIISALEEKGYTFHARPQTNQIFIEVSNADALRLAARVEFSTWEKLGTDRRVIRLSTSWATRHEDAEALAGLL